MEPESQEVELDWQGRSLNNKRKEEKLKAGLIARGCELYGDSPTNQQFIVADDALLKKLDGEVAYGFWEALAPGRTAIRFATSWATRPEDVDALLALL